MDAVETFQHGGRTIRICYDDSPENPRTTWDHATTMVCHHRRYVLGDKDHGFSDREKATLLDELRESRDAAATLSAALKERGEEVLAMLPLYLLDHSGISISVGDFGDPWDSGQVGWVYCTRDSVDAMGLTVNSTEDAELIIRREVRLYDHYLRGEIYGYEILGLDGDVLESCWGFYGIEEAREDAKLEAPYTSDPAVEAAAEEMRSRVTFAG